MLRPIPGPLNNQAGMLHACGGVCVYIYIYTYVSYVYYAGLWVLKVSVLGLKGLAFGAWGLRLLIRVLWAVQAFKAGIGF